MRAMAVRLAVALATGVLLTSTSVSAGDDIYMLPISEAMASPDVEGRLDKSIHYYFGDTAHPAVERTFGEFVTNQKTNTFGKSYGKACTWVFLSAMLQLEKRARDLGANAVIGINSYYKKNEVSNQTEIECHHGLLLAGIALKGTFVSVR
jgi:uncharacterized protein YbjQ (UPF0145 family)